MRYDVLIQEKDILDEYQGSVSFYISELDVCISAAYLAPISFMDIHMIEGTRIPVDLWLFDGTAKESKSPRLYFPHDHGECGGTFCGIITDVHNDREYRLDCNGLIIDVLDERDISPFSIKTVVEISGTYQVFFPYTEYSKEECWG